MKRPLTWVLLILLVGLLVYLFYFSPGNASKKGNKTATNSSLQTKQFKLKVNSKQVYIDGKMIELKSPVLEIDGRTMVPLRFIADYLHATKLQYDEKTEEITFYLDLPEKTKQDQEKKSDTTEQKEPPKQEEPKTEETKTEETNDTTVTVYDQLLTKEKEERIKSIARVSTTLYKLAGITSDGKNIVITIDLLMEPESNAAVRKITDPMANETASIFNNKSNISIKAIRKTGTKPTVVEYGTSFFNASTGKVEFQEVK